MSNWQKKTLKEVVSLWVRGSTPRRNHTDYYWGKDGVPFVRVGDLKGQELTETELYLTLEGAEQVKGVVPKGAVLLSVSGTIGKVAIAGREVKVNQAVQAMVFNENLVLSKYGYYYFQFFRPWLEEIANTVTIPNLTKTRLEQTSILFPCLEEQRYIVSAMERGEQLLEKQGEIREVLQKILYQVMYEKVKEALAGKQTVPLGNFFIEPISNGQDAENRDRTEGYQQKVGELLLQKRKEENSDRFCVLSHEKQDALYAPETLWRVRIHREKLKPEFLLLWIYYGRDCLGIDFYEGKRQMDKHFLARFPVPKVFFETQEKLAHLVEKAGDINKKLEDRTDILKRLYNSLLSSSFTAFLSRNFRKKNQLEDPDEDLFNQYYHLQKKETFGVNVRWETNWINIFSGKEREILNDLSDFQQEILGIFAGTEEAMPIHVVFQMLEQKNPKCYRKHTIQDARTAVKILMGLGFLERTIPEKLVMEGSVLMDSKEKPVTIQKYKSLL